MDILKKFRYNFHYWLKNCYQAGGDPREEVKASPSPQEQAEATAKQNKKYMVL